MKKTLENNYHSFRLRNDFFENPKIIAMENEPGGAEIIIILFKIYCLSIAEKGNFKLPNFNGKPDYNALARLLRHDATTVEMAIQYFLNNGFLEMASSEDGKNTVITITDLIYDK